MTTRERGEANLLLIFLIFSLAVLIFHWCILFSFLFYYLSCMDIAWDFPLLFSP